MRFVAVVLLLAACLAVRLPGSLIDAAVDQASAGALHLAQARGSVWHGGGALMVADPVTQRWQSWLALDWDADFSQLWRGIVGWRFTSGGGTLAEIEIGAGGIGLTKVQIRGPARFFLERIPNALGRGGWEGDVAIDSPSWHCSWTLRCDGSAELRWYGASSSLLPMYRLGDYRASISGMGGDISAHIDTTGGGEAHIDGDGHWTIGGTPGFTGTLRGNPVLLGRLPSVAGRWVRNGGEPGVWLVSLP